MDTLDKKGKIKKKNPKKKLKPPRKYILNSFK